MNRIGKYKYYGNILLSAIELGVGNHCALSLARINAGERHNPFDREQAGGLKWVGVQ